MADREPDRSKNWGQLSKMFKALGIDSRQNIDLIIHHASLVMGTCFSFYVKPDFESGQETVQAGTDLPREFESRLTASKIFTDCRSIRDPMALSLPDMAGSPVKEKACEIMDSFHIKSWFCVPVFPMPWDSGTSGPGFLNVADTSFRRFSRNDMDALTDLASALALEERRLIEAENSQKRHRERSAELAHVLEQAEKQRVLIENINDAVVILQEGFIRFANPKSAELSGYTVEELTTIPFSRLIHPEEREKVLERHKRRLLGEQFQHTHSFRVICKQGHPLWVQINAARIIWDNKPAILACLRDITRINELEERLDKLEKMELIGTVAGGVAHDLNNILSGLVSYPEVLLLQLEKGSPLVEPITFIHDAGKKAAAITQDLLALTRRRVVQKGVINLNNMIHEYFNSSAHNDLEQNYPRIRFCSNSEPELLNIKGSESHISKIVMNLILNATEAVGSTGTVRIETLNRYVDTPIRGYDHVNEGEYAVLRISDDGPGIPESDLPRIFEPFYTRKRMGKSGSGLGLSVVWNAVKDHHGYIEVKSRQDKGTTFELYFPATRHGRPLPPGNFQISDFKGNNERILVIDDIKEQRKIARGCLDMLGYSPFSAVSGEAALEFLKDHPMELLIIDMKMDPGMDGLETYERALEINPGQRAVMTSGYSENKRSRKALALGAAGFLKKPFTIQNLAIAIKKGLTSEDRKI